jgi:hypothetical protein
MAVVSVASSPGADLEAARTHTRQLAFGEIIGAVFPIRVGPGEDEKAWYRVIGLRPLRMEWLPYTPYQVSAEVLADLSKTSIYRLIEADIAS